MRIVVVNNFFPPRVGGSAHVSDALARLYAAAGHEVLVLTAAYGGAVPYEHRDGITIARLPSWTLPESRLTFNFDISFALKSRNLNHVCWLLDRFKPDVIHQHGQFFDLTWQSGLWARRRKVPTVLTIHTRLESPTRLSGAIFRGLDAGVVDPILRFLRPKKIIGMDVLYLEYLRNRYHFTEDQIEYVPLGVELDRFRDVEPTDIRARFGLGDGPVAMSLGHAIPVRNRMTLVEALPAVLAKHPGFKILVVGGVYTWDFLQRAGAMGVMHALVVTGPLPKSDIPGICANVDFDTHDLQGYGVGISSIEVMATGTPIIVSVRPDLWPHAILTDGKEVVLTPKGDATALAENMCRLIENPELRKAIGQRGRQYVFANLDMKIVAQRNLAVLEQVVAAAT